MAELFGITEKVYRVSNFVDHEKIKRLSSESVRLPGKKLFTTLGRLDYNKNHILLLKAVKELKKQRSDFMVYILGDGDERKRLEEPAMNVFLFLKGELRQSKGVFFGLTVLLALALAVAVSVIQTERMVKSSTIRAAEQFDILVGARGSRSALLLGTVYLRDEMLGLVPMPVLNNLSPKSFPK